MLGTSAAASNEVTKAAPDPHRRDTNTPITKMSTPATVACAISAPSMLGIAARQRCPAFVPRCPELTPSPVTRHHFAAEARRQRSRCPKGEKMFQPGPPVALLAVLR